MVSTMKNVTMSSSTFLSSAKTVAVDPSAPQAKNNLANAARYLVTLPERQTLPQLTGSSVLKVFDLKMFCVEQVGFFFLSTSISKCTIARLEIVFSSKVT
jgi:hypothetical protein